MSSSTNRVDINGENYVAVSNGNMNCAVMVRYNQKVRGVISGGTPPLKNTEDYFIMSGGKEEFSGARFTLAFDNLAGDDELWVRTESGEDTILVVRGGLFVSGRK